MTGLNSGTTRRDFMKNTGGVAAVSALAGTAIPHVHAAENNTINIALVGCGGRGTGAVENALKVKNGPIKLVAMADVFQDRLDRSYENINKRYAKQVDVPADRKFIGFDAYKKAMDCLKPGDVVLLTTPPAFRWVQFTYAIAKGINVFMEKPVTVDGPSTRKMLALAEQARKKNLKVGVGLMCRHCKARGELRDRIQNGEIGDLVTLRAFRMVSGGGQVGPNTSDMSELLWQIRHFHSFMWASGGCFMDFLIHNIDECCWMKDAWPVQAQGSGALLSRGQGRSELRSLYHRIHLRRRLEADDLRPDDSRLPAGVRQLRARLERFGRDLDLGALPGQEPHLQGPVPQRQGGSHLVVPAARDESV